MAEGSKVRRLSLEDIRQFCRTVTALTRTMQTQAEIDRLYPQVEKTTLAVESPPQV